MFEWFTANAATIIIGAVLFSAVFAAGRSVFKKAKNGGCAGCARGKTGCSGAPACFTKK